MKNSVKLALVAVVCLVALILVFMQMRTAAPPVVNQPPPTPREPTEKVLVARNELPPGTPITSLDLRWQDWPKGSVPANVIVQSARPRGLDEIVNKRPRVFIRQNDVITQDKLSQSPGGIYAEDMKPGYRIVALPIATDGQTTSGNFIFPKDRVDVLQISKEMGNVTQVILRDIEVYAIGSAVDATTPTGPSITRGPANSITNTMVASTISLIGTEAETRTLLEASKRGGLYYFLRPFTEKADGQTIDDNTMNVPRLMIRFGVLQGG